MFFGHGNIDGIDFWGEAVFPQYSDDTVFGRTVFKKLEEVRGGADSGVLQANFELTGPRGRADRGRDPILRLRGRPKQPVDGLRDHLGGQSRFGRHPG